MALIMLLTIVSLNVSRLRNNFKRKIIFYFLKKKKIDIIFYKKLIPITPMKSCGNVNGKGIYFIFMVIIIVMMWRH